MSKSPIRSRRTWPVCSTLAIAMLVGSSVSLGATVQPPAPKTAPKQPGKSNQPGKAPATPTAPPTSADLGEDLGMRVLKRVKQRDWILNVEVRVQGVKYSDNVDGKLIPNQARLSFTSAAIIFPILTGTGTSFTSIAGPDSLDSELTFNDVDQHSTPKLQDGYASGTRLARWELKDCEGRGWTLKIKLPITSFEVELDEELANQVPWPKDWPPIAKSTFQPQMFVDYVKKPEEKQENDKVIQELIKRWLNGRDPKSMPPAVLAKELTGHVLEYVQPTGDSRMHSKSGAFEGLDLYIAAEVAKTPRADDHSVAGFLAAVFRNAGLPARTVYGWDLSEKKDKNSGNFLERATGKDKLRSWVEFALVDPREGKEIWIPVDVVRLRKSSSRAPAMDRPWKWFGTHEEMAFVLPFAFQIHPPTTVVAHGFPAFYGWLTTPSSQYGEQSVRFYAITAPRRSGEPAPAAPGSPK